MNRQEVKERRREQQSDNRSRDTENATAEGHRKLRLQHQNDRHRYPIRSPPVEFTPDRVSYSQRERQSERVAKHRGTKIQIRVQRCNRAAKSQPERLLFFAPFKRSGSR